jgi:hypothetical protein
MTFHEQLASVTSADREFLLSAPVIQRALSGDVTRELYVAFLTQAYHHVRHTVPLLMAVGARVPDRYAWLREAILHYLEEETGHDEWILNDIERGIVAANRRLPGYAQVRRWARVPGTFSFQNGLLTSNGRLRRAAILERHGALLAPLYDDV